MKNKFISISIVLVLLFTSLVSVQAIAPTPRIELDDYQISTNDKKNVFITGTLNKCVGQNVGIFDSSGKIMYNYYIVDDTNSSGTFKVQIPSRCLNEGENTFKVKSTPLKDIINSSNPKTVTITVKTLDKKNQIITANDATVFIGKLANINAKVDSGLPLTYVSNNPEIATVDIKGNVLGRKKGKTTITIKQAGNDSYNAASKTVSVTVKDYSDDEVVTTPPASAKTYTITYNANYGTGSMSAQKVKENVSTKLKANTFKRPYYTFVGWSQSKNGNVVYKNGATIKPNRNLTLYAKWTASYKKPNGKVAEGQSPKAGIAYGKMKYSKGSHSRGIVCVIRAKDPGLANAIADNAEKITNNNKIGYSTKSGVGPKLYTQLIKYGPSKASGKASCCPFALCSLKYAMYTNPEYRFATDSKYGINCNWRSDSKTNIRTGMKSVKSKIEKSKKSCPYVMIYDTSSFKNWKTKLYRGDIAICKHHVFVVL